MEAAGRRPFTVDFTKRIARNQYLARPVVSGEELYPEREAALDFSLLRNGESPESHTVLFSASIRGRMAVDYGREIGWFSLLGSSGAEEWRPKRIEAFGMEFARMAIPHIHSVWSPVCVIGAGLYYLKSTAKQG